MIGRPKIYESVEELELKVEEYINSFPVGSTSKPTITGACLFLGFCDKSTLYDYRDREEFSHSIKRLLLYVEHGYELALHGNSVTGSIFALKNMGWKDKTESEVNGNMGLTWNETRNYNKPQELK